MKSPPFLHERISSFCPRCSHQIRTSLRHYDLLACHCGATLWALRPLKDGKLNLFMHPNDATQPP